MGMSQIEDADDWTSVYMKVVKMVKMEKIIYKEARLGRYVTSMTNRITSLWDTLLRRHFWLLHRNIKKQHVSQDLPHS